MFQNHWRERESFYIYSANAEEIEKKECTKSGRYETAAEACAAALLLEEVRGARKVVVERHYEFFDGYYREWEIDWNQNGGRLVVWSYDFVSKVEVKE